ncbi:MAG: hypothetical protein ACI9KE_004949 [Polyangiales bacterium]|jgi:hypothetical protein
MSNQVLFIHGLEGHPNGSKVRMLRDQGFDVRAENMHMSLMQFRKRNSAVRNVFRLAEVRVCAALFVASFVAAAALHLPMLSVGAVGIAAWLFLRRRALLGAALNKSFITCVDIQRQALASNPPDILIGSSWGGAVAAELIATGAWKGPTILLAPAIERVDVWARRGDLAQTTAALRAAAEASPVLIFHDPADETVPHADSVRLAEGSAIDLRTVDAGGHRLLLLLERGELAEAVREATRARLETP